MLRMAVSVSTTYLLIPSLVPESGLRLAELFANEFTRENEMKVGIPNKLFTK